MKVLYKGCFSDGKFDDSTGKAWELVFDSSNGINQYFYYKGIFRKGIVPIAKDRLCGKRTD